jgi:putative transposase
MLPVPRHALEPAHRYGACLGWRAGAGRNEGSEYTAALFRAACERMGIAQSMGWPGSALDNALQESWHSTLEFELRRVRHFATRARARAAVAAWIENYNTARRHSALGMLSPAAYEHALLASAVEVA